MEPAELVVGRQRQQALVVSNPAGKRACKRTRMRDEGTLSLPLRKRAGTGPIGGWHATAAAPAMADGSRRIRRTRRRQPDRGRGRLKSARRLRTAGRRRRALAPTHLAIRMEQDACSSSYCGRQGGGGGVGGVRGRGYGHGVRARTARAAVVEALLAASIAAVGTAKGCWGSLPSAWGDAGAEHRAELAAVPWPGAPWACEPAPGLSPREARSP